MPSLKNILHRRETISQEKSPIQTASPAPIPTSPPPPEITFLRSDTFGHEVITPPVYPDHEDNEQIRSSPDQLTSSTTSPRRSFQLFRRSSRSGSLSNPPSPQPRRERRLSNLLHLDHRSRSNSRDSSVNIPQDLPQIEDGQEGDEKEKEALWEKRATVLVQKNPQFGHSSPIHSQTDLRPGQMPRSRSSSSVGDQQDDVCAVLCCVTSGHVSGRLSRSYQC